MKRLKEKLKNAYKVKSKEVIKGKPKKFIWAGSKTLIHGAKVYEMNPESYTIRQICKIPTLVKRVDIHSLFEVPFWKSLVPNEVMEDRYNWKEGMIYTQGSTSNSIQKKFKKFLDSQLLEMKRNSNK